MADNPRIEDLRRRVQSDPASIAFAALAEEYRRAGQYEEAIATCKAGLQRHPAYLSARVTLGRALIEVNQFDEARQELEYVLKVAPENLAAIRALAEIHHRRGDVQEEEHYGAALDTGRRDAHAADTAAHPPPPAPVAAAAPMAPAAPAPATMPAPTPSVQPIRVQQMAAADPALDELEALLAAIARARQELETASTTR